MTNNAARKWNASTTTHGVWWRHWFDTVESELTKWSVAFPVLSCEVPAHSVCLVVASHRVIDHGSNEIISLSVIFQSSNSFFLPAALRHAGMAKASRKSCRRKAFGNSLNFYQHFLMPGLSWKGRPSLCGVVPGPLDWDYATRLDLVVSFLISMLRLVHSDSTSTHINTLHTLRTHTHCERELFCLATRKVKTETEVKKVECLLLCLGRRAVLEQAVHDQLLWLSTNFPKFARRAQNALGQSEHSSLTSHSIFVRQTPLPTSCRENALVRLCSWAKKTVTFYFHNVVEHCDG